MLGLQLRGYLNDDRARRGRSKSKDRRSIASRPSIEPPRKQEEPMHSTPVRQTKSGRSKRAPFAVAKCADFDGN